MAPAFKQLFPDQNSVHSNGVSEVIPSAFEPIWRSAEFSDQPEFGQSRLSSETEKVSLQTLQDRKYAEGFAAGQAEAMAEAEMKVARAFEDFERQLQSARAAWVANEAERLAALIEIRTTGAIAAVRTSITKILQASVMNALQRCAVESVVAKVAQVTSRAARASVTIGGRQDLADAIANGLAQRNIETFVEPSSSPEVWVRFGNAEIETQINTAIDVLIGAP